MREESRKKAILFNKKRFSFPTVDEDTRVGEEETTCTVFNIICLMIERIEIPYSDVGEGSDLEWKDDDDCNYSDLNFVDSFDDWSTFQTIFNPTRSSRTIKDHIFQLFLIFGGICATGNGHASIKYLATEE